MQIEPRSKIQNLCAWLESGANVDKIPDGITRRELTELANIYGAHEILGKRMPIDTISPRTCEQWLIRVKYDLKYSPDSEFVQIGIQLSQKKSRTGIIAIIVAIIGIVIGAFF